MFGVLDSIVFFITLAICVLIGVYFGCFGTKQNTANEYLFANRNMTVIPVGLSLYSSAVSTVAILGIPSEIYLFGTQFVIAVVGNFCSLLITWNCILPIFCGSMNFKTPYEYYELRFGSNVRCLCSVIYIINILLYIPVALLSIGLIVSQVLEVHLIICTTLIGGICVFYTMLGGFKSVIWTDVLQATLMLFSILFILITSIYKLGGFSEIWSIAEKGDRLKFFNMDPNPFVRSTFWSTAFGTTIFVAAHTGCAASSLQRYMTLSKSYQGKLCTLIGASGMAVVTIISTLIGLCMYAYYYLCDPLLNKEVQNPNQIISKFVNEIAGDIPGFVGLFYAGVLSAGLSTISAELNTVAGLVYHDFIVKYVKYSWIDKNATIILKSIVVIVGMFILIFTPFLANVHYILQLATLIAGLTYGPKLGTMLLGTTFPKSNSYGVFIGSITGFCITLWFSLGSIYYNVAKPYVLPLSTENCSVIHNDIFMNITKPRTPLISMEEPLIVYKLSYLLYPALGTIITVGVGIITSYMTGVTDVNKIDPRLIVSFVRPSNQNINLKESIIE